MSKPSYRGRSVSDLERIRVHVMARVYDNDWKVRHDARKELELLDKALANARKREAKANPGRPSLVGDIAESFVPLDLMERTAEGAFSDVSRLARTPSGHKRKNPLYRVKFEDTGTRLYSTYDLRKAKEYAKDISHQGKVTVEKWSDDGTKLKGIVYTYGNNINRKNPPDAVVHVVRAGRGKYVVKGLEIANCGSHCPALPNPNVVFTSLAKVKTWAKGLFKGDRRNRKVELVLQ